MNSRSKQISKVAELELCSRVYRALKIRIEAIIVESITQGQIEIPSRWIKNIALEKGIEFAYIGNSKDRYFDWIRLHVRNIV